MNDRSLGVELRQKGNHVKTAKQLIDELMTNAAPYSRYKPFVADKVRIDQDTGRILSVGEDLTAPEGWEVLPSGLLLPRRSKH